MSHSIVECPRCGSSVELATNSTGASIICTSCKSAFALAVEAGSFVGHQGLSHFVAFSSKKNIVVSAGTDLSVRWWNTDSGEQVHSLALKNALLKCWPEAGIGLTQSPGFESEVVDLLLGNLICRLSGQTKPVECAALDAVGKRLVTGGADGKLRVWDIRNGRELQCYNGHELAVGAVAIHPCGSLAASGSFDGTIRCWELETGKQLWSSASGGRITLIAFTNEGQFLLADPPNSTARPVDTSISIWETASGRLVRRLQPYERVIRSLACSPVSRTAATGDNMGHISIWGIANAQQICSFRAHDGAVTAVTFSHDARHIVTAGGDKKTRLWALAKFKETLTPRAQSDTGSVGNAREVARNPSTATPISADAAALPSQPTGEEIRLLPLSETEEMTIQERQRNRSRRAGSPHTPLSEPARINSASLLNQVGFPSTLGGHSSEIQSLAFSPNGCTLAAASGKGGYPGGELLEWDLATGKIRNRVPDDCPVNTLAFSSDGKTLVTGSGKYGQSGIVNVFVAENMRLQRTLAGHSCAVECVAVSPNGTVLASAGGPYDRKVLLRELSGAASVSTLELPEECCRRSIAFSPDGTSLATVAGHLKFWDVSKGKLRWKAVPNYEVNSVAFSPTGDRVVTGGGYGELKFWDATTGELLFGRGGHDELLHISIYDVAFSPNGLFLAVASYDERQNTSEVQLWDVGSGKLQRVWHDHGRNVVWTLAFSRDSCLLASGGSDKKVRLWHVIEMK